MAGYCTYEMYLFSRISKKLFEQVFLHVHTHADKNTYLSANIHKPSAAKCYLIQKEQLQSMTQT